jgi:hypothetical protein
VAGDEQRLWAALSERLGELIRHSVKRFVKATMDRARLHLKPGPGIEPDIEPDIEIGDPVGWDKRIRARKCNDDRAVPLHDHTARVDLEQARSTAIVIGDDLQETQVP